VGRNGDPTGTSQNLEEMKKGGVGAVPRKTGKRRGVSWGIFWTARGIGAGPALTRRRHGLRKTRFFERRKRKGGACALRAVLRPPGDRTGGEGGQRRRLHYTSLKKKIHEPRREQKEPWCMEGPP